MRMILLLSVLAMPAFAAEYPVKGCWHSTDNPGEYKQCTTPDSPEIQRERGYSYATGVLEGFQWALDSITDPYGMEGWGCPREGEKPVRNDQKITWADVKGWRLAKPRPFSDKITNEPSDDEVMAGWDDTKHYPKTEKALRKFCE